MKKAILFGLLFAFASPAFGQDFRVTVGGEFSSNRTLIPAARLDYHKYLRILPDGLAQVYGFYQRDIVLRAQFGLLVDVAAEWPTLEAGIRATYAWATCKSEAKMLRVFGYNLYPLLDTRYPDWQAPHGYAAQLRYTEVEVRLLREVFRWATWTQAGTLRERLTLDVGAKASYAHALFEQASLTTSHAYVCYSDWSYCGLWHNDITLANTAGARLWAGGILAQLRYQLTASELELRVGANIGRLASAAHFIDVDDVVWGGEHIVYDGDFELPTMPWLVAYPEMALTWRGTADFLQLMAGFAFTAEPRAPELKATSWTVHGLGFERIGLVSTARLMAGIVIGMG